MALADAAPFAVAHWTLDEASGDRVDSINGYTLTDVNTVGSAAGKFGSAADFERSNSEALTLADTADLRGADIDFMVRCWVRLESTGVSQGIAGKYGTGATREYLLFINSSTRPAFIVRSAGGTSTTVTWGSALSAGVDYLLHAWHDAAGNVLGIAVDAATAVTAAHIAGVQGTTAPFEVGRHDLSLNHFDGLIDDLVFLRGRLLDATERTEDYNGGSGVAFADWAGGGGGPTATEPFIFAF